MASINLGRVVGDPGPKGDRGTVWHLGTGVTGQSTTGTVFSGSGVESAALQDMYLNTNTDDFYTCVLAGNAATAKWAYAGNLKGATGPQGATGPTGKVDSNTPVTFETAATETDINSGESLGTLMGKIKKSISTFRSAIGTLSTLKTNAKTSLVAAINEIFAANNDLSQAVNGKVSASDLTWKNILGKPGVFPPSGHIHDDRYYTMEIINNLLNGKVSFIYGSFAGAYEFVANLQGRNKVALGYFQDSAGWTPVGGAWWNVWAVQQNDIESEYDVGVNVIIARGTEAYFGYLGKSDGGIGPQWFPLFRRIAYQSIGSANGVTGNLWSNGSVVTVEVEGGLTATINAWSDMTLGYVPEGLQPPTTCVFPVSGATTTNGVCVQISNDRRVAICNRSNNAINAENWEVFTMCTYALAF